MSQLKIGQIAPDFTFRTAWQENQKFSSWAEKADKTLLMFSRYYGCSLCQLDIAELAEIYPKVLAKGAQALVVLQSSPEVIQSELKEDSLPFPLVLDPEQTIYRAYDLNVAEDLKKAVNAKTLVKLAKSKLKGYQHGKYEGNENQLQGMIIVDRNLKVLYANYAKNLSDLPDGDDLLRLFS